MTTEGYLDPIIVTKYMRLQVESEFDYLISHLLFNTFSDKLLRKKLYGKSWTNMGSNMDKLVTWTKFFLKKYYDEWKRETQNEIKGNSENRN